MAPCGYGKPFRVYAVQRHGRSTMPTLEPDVHVFVIRVRSEPREIPGAPPEWRFWIEHLPGGEQHHYRDFAGVLSFIAGYLPEQALSPDRTPR